MHKDFRPTFAQLRTFAVIAEFSHFGIAAKQLGVSQPSLSQTLVALETGLGVQLVERSTRRVIITEAGQTLLPFAQATLESCDAFIAEAQGVQGGLVGTLPLGLIPTVAPYVLPELLKDLSEAAPELLPRIVEDKTLALAESLRSGHLDVAVLGGELEDSNFHSVPLFDEEFVLVVQDSSQLAGRTDLELEDIAQEKILLLDDGHCLTDQIVDMCSTVKMSHNPRQSLTRATSLTTVMQLVAAGFGSTLVPLSAVAVESTRTGLSFARFTRGSDVASRCVVLTYRSSTPRAADYAELSEIITGAIRTVTKRSEHFLDGASSESRIH